MKHSAANITPLRGHQQPLGGCSQFVHYQVLRDGAQAQLDSLLRLHAGHPELLKVQQASRDLARSLQALCLDLRRVAPDDGQALRQALEHQLCYLQACLKRSFSDY